MYIARATKLSKLHTKSQVSKMGLDFDTSSEDEYMCKYFRLVQIRPAVIETLPWANPEFVEGSTAFRK
jgi:hypothetical protein